MPKNGLFIRKNCKSRRSVRGSAPNPRCGVVVLIYYCSFEIL